MKIKSIFVTSIILALGLFITGCNAERALPVVISLEESVKEIIISKGNNYDFLEDELYNIKMEELINTILSKLKPTKIVYKLGNLDEDSIPEIAVFIERKPEDTEDQGLLQVYKFNGERYEKIDEINMNYDNNNYQMEIGKLSENQNGLLLNNQVGAHSGITYGYILKDNKLKSILNDKKLNLLSVYTSNVIRDQDEDGILEFSIYTIDPETIEQSAAGSDKITLWYKWDGIDGGILTLVEKDNSNLDSNNQILSTRKESLADIEQIIDYNSLLKNQSQLSFIDNTLALTKYIEGLKEGLNLKNGQIQELFNNYQPGYLLNEYAPSPGQFSIERLNDIEYLKREKTLVNEGELKNSLINNLEQGYKLTSSEGLYHYIIDYSKLVQNSGEFISKEYRDYLKIMALDIDEPYLIGDSLMISQDKLMERINILEQFIITYPYSIYLPETKSIYKLYTKSFIFGDIHNLNFDSKTNKLKVEVLNNWNIAIDKYPNSYFTDILSKLSVDIQNNQNTLSSEIKEKYKSIYD